MAKYYLHKQTLIIAIICILAVGTATAYTYVKPSSQSSDEIVVENDAINSGDNIITNDTDWKKQFFDKSSSTNSIVENKDVTNGSVNEPITLTGQMGRELFARFIDLKKNGLDSNTQLVQDAIDRTINNGFNAVEQPKQYEMKDLLIQNQESTESYHAYGNTIGSIMTNYMPIQNSAMVTNDALEKNDMSLLENIDPLIVRYEKVGKLLLSTSVPSTLSKNHLDLINSIYSMIFASQKFKNIQTDPMQSMVALGINIKAENSFNYSINTLKQYFSTMRIVFINTEPGIYFSNITR